MIPDLNHKKSFKLNNYFFLQPPKLDHSLDSCWQGLLMTTWKNFVEFRSMSNFGLEWFSWFWRQNYIRLNFLQLVCRFVPTTLLPWKASVRCPPQWRCQNPHCQRTSKDQLSRERVLSIRQSDLATRTSSQHGSGPCHQAYLAPNTKSRLWSKTKSNFETTM